MEPDFGGYATKAGLRCSDGRTITPGAFEHQNGKQVPLVWQHGHNDPANVLGHAVLEARPDGVYAYGFFNSTPSGQQAKELVMHKDINAMSIFANQLKEKMKAVQHGVIREVSLVLSGANPGALIDFVRLAHGDDPDNVLVLDDEAVIYTGLTIEHAGLADEDETVEHAASTATIQDVIDTFDDDQKKVVAFLIGEALDAADSGNATAEHSDTEGSTDTTKTEDALEHKEEEGTDNMRRNVFEQNAGRESSAEQRHVLTHSDIKGIMQDALKGGSLKDAVEGYVLSHGIEDIDLLFPDAKTLESTPQFNKRRTEWVAGVLNGTRHSPFSRVKTIVADLTQAEARAKGYIKGNYKAEEWFGVSRRTTSPTTIYKKQKLDRDDILDITDFDVVAYLKMEMRMMLEEEVARAILIGDGRDVSDTDKVKDPIGAADGVGIRSIYNDHELFVTTLYVNVDDASSTYDEVIDAVMDGMEFYKGTGTPDFYCTIKTLNLFMQAKDTTGRRLYPTKADVAAALGVNSVITVEPMNEVSDLVGIVVNLDDYNIGTDKGGEVSFFDDFDIDYNQQKYLTETRLSGALTKVKSALIVKKVSSGAALVKPTVPTFVTATGVVTIPTKTGVVYKDGAGTTLSAGAQTALDPGESMTVNAFPSSSSYYFANNAEDSWTFKRPSA